MHIIVSGATGFIGQALVRELLRRDHRVTALTRDGADVRRKLGPEVTPVEWHPPQIGAWTAALNGADGVVNLSGVPVVSPFKPWTASYKAAVRDSRVNATRCLVEAIRGADPRPRVLVNQSAIGYYGSPGATPLTEESPAGNDFLAGVVKDWEEAGKPAEELGVRLVLPRTAIVLGKGGLLAQLSLPFRLFAGGTMGYPDQWVSWIHLDDEVNLLIHALERDDVRGPINGSAPEPVTMDVFSRAIGVALQRPVWVPFYGPFLKLVLGQRAQVVLASQRVLPERTLATGFHFAHTDVGEAVRAALQ
jgi:uncharacterized protein (TIGR01777 family)